MVAKMNPRNQQHAMDRILNACMRPSLAEGAMYSYARGGNDITGASIRLAEAIAQQWGNIQFGMREIAQADGESTVQAYAWDVETNTRKEVVFHVPHVRYSKRGNTKLTDPRDIYETIANNGARRLRACILAIIPSDVVELAVAQCKTTLRASADTSPDNILKLVQKFDEIDVTKEQIEKRIQRRIESIQPAQILSLRKIYTSIKDGMSRASDWFEEIEDSNSLNKLLKKQQEEPKEKAPKTGTEKEKDMLENIEIEPTQEEINYQTGEVIKAKKPNMALLDKINTDGTDVDDDIPFY
jgi:hypothetical protein